MAEVPGPVPPFVHLRVHSEYSLVDGIVRLKPLVKAVAAAGMPAVAVTEQGNLFSLVRFYRAAVSGGVKPLIGVDTWLHDEADPAQPARLLLLCQHGEGYRNLTRLVSRGYLEGQVRGVPMLRREWLEGGAADGLIVLSGGMQGDVGRALLAGNRDAARARLDHWQALFGDRYYLEIQRLGRAGEEDYLDAALDLAAGAGAGVVATNDVCFLAPEDFEAHEARVCIHDGRSLADPRRVRRHTEQQYLRSPAEMAELFADVPEALDNAVEIARRCNVDLRLGENFLPDFPVPAGKTLEQWFEEQSRAGLEARLASLFDTAAPDFAERRAVYDQRLAKELEVIKGMGFPGYFLIVADFIRWSRDNGVPVGPGRGSGAGSLVAYALGITDLDPIAYDLLFERFLNPERVSLPDFDVDFCMDGRDRVIGYVAERYGRERVSQIITFGTMAAKAVVRDVGRVLGHPYGFVDQIAKLIPFDLGITLDRALEGEEQLRARYEEEEEVRAIIDLARKLEGVARNAGKHAGGVVIAPSALTDFTPLYCEQGSGSIVTQLDKDDVEAVGLVKFDFLGLRTLTIVDRAVRNINEIRARTGEPALNISAIPTDDEQTYALIKKAATTAVFQLESRGMKDLIRRLQPDCFEDVIALVALFRPGPLQSGMVDDFIDRKHGRARVAYPHPELEPILKPTYGVILYQEQVMQIAQVLAGYSLGGADLLRRAMGKKKPEEMAKQRAVFQEGASGRGVEADTAAYIFDLMEKFAGYGFNKSHSAAYALIAYQTAWLKAHYPAAFMAAVLSADLDNTDKVVVFIDECRTLGLAVEPPDVNTCDYPFTVADPRTIRYGLGAIKGVGQGAIDAILQERGRGGAFADLFDLCRRIDTRRANRRVLEALIRAGALDALGPSRAAMMATLTQALQAAEQHVRDSERGQEDLFGGTVVESAPVCRFAETEEWPDEERLLGEKETLGLYLTGHPIERYEADVARFATARLGELRPRPGQKVVVAGLVVAMRTINSRRGRMAVLNLDDGTGRVEAVAYSETFHRYRESMVKDRLLVVEGEVKDDDMSEGCSIVVETLYDIDQARSVYARCLRIEVAAAQAANGFLDRLEHALAPFRDGSTPVRLVYRSERAEVALDLGEEWRIMPRDELLERLRELTAPGRVEVLY